MRCIVINCAQPGGGAAAAIGQRCVVPRRSGEDTHVVSMDVRVRDSVPDAAAGRGARMISLISVSNEQPMIQSCS